MSKIPTAKEFLKEVDEYGKNNLSDVDGLSDLFIIFAKLHVKAALEAANEKRLEEGANWNPHTILSAYPENLIH